MYGKRKLEARSCNHCYHGKAKIRPTTYCDCMCVCVCVALGTQREMLGRHTVICGLHRFTIFCQFISKGFDFQKNRSY